MSGLDSLHALPHEELKKTGRRKAHRYRDMVNAAAAREGSGGDEEMDQNATGRTRASRARSSARAPRHQAADPGRSRRAAKRFRS